MNTNITSRARFSGFGLYHLTLALMLGLALGMMLALSILVTAGAANAGEGRTDTTVVATYGDTSTVVDVHNVVVSSTLRHCPLEDGGPRVRRDGACTWNVGAVDGNGAGLAYVLYMNARTHQLAAVYVWNHNPAVSGWHWVTDTGSTADCVVKAGVNRARCADGTYRR